jgi:hypothetical protein
MEDAAALALAGGVLGAAVGFDAGIEAFGLPAFLPLGFPLGQIRLHGEIGAGEKNGIAFPGRVGHGALVR